MLQFLMRAAQIGKTRLRLARGLPEFLRACSGGLRASVGRKRPLRLRGAIRFHLGQRDGPLRFCRGEPRHGFLALHRFGVAAHRFFAETHGGDSKLFDPRLERLLFAGLARGGIRSFAQGGFERGGVRSKLGHRFLMRGHAILQFSRFTLDVPDFDDNLRRAHLDLARLFLIENDAIFGAIEIERRLAQDILRAAIFPGARLRYRDAALCWPARCAKPRAFARAIRRSAAPSMPGASARQAVFRLQREYRSRATDSAARLRFWLRPAAAWSYT